MSPNVEASLCPLIQKAARATGRGQYRVCPRALVASIRHSRFHFKDVARRIASAGDRSVGVTRTAQSLFIGLFVPGSLWLSGSLHRLCRYTQPHPRGSLHRGYPSCPKLD